MDAVILFSHGSLLCGSGEALKRHAADLRTRNFASIVEVGYLNYSEPPFSDAVATCVAAGANRIIVTPYFLVPGKFVKVDLPGAIDHARRDYPLVTFLVAEAIGFDESLADALIESAQAATTSESWGDDLRRASEHCRDNPDCPLYGTAACPRHPTTVCKEAYR